MVTLWAVVRHLACIDDVRGTRDVKVAGYSGGVVSCMTVVVVCIYCGHIRVCVCVCVCVCVFAFLSE